jgi:anti-sigma28 factor (negative regulator of flagellin synthesis)
LKIDNFTPSTDLQSTQIDKTQQTENARSQRGGKTPAAQDSASISSLAQQISQALETESPERVASVAEAQKLYQSGDFHVPTGDVADSLIQSAVADTALSTRVSAPSAEV